MTANLYQRLGGAAGVAAIVDNAIDRHAANPLLAPRLRGRDLPHLKTLSEVFLSARSGGPPQHPSCGMQTTHAGMNFSADEWAAVVDDIAAAMVEHGAGAAEVRELASLLHAPPGTIQEQVLRTVRVGGSDDGPANPPRRLTT